MFHLTSTQNNLSLLEQEQQKTLKLTFDLGVEAGKAIQTLYLGNLQLKAEEKSLNSDLSQIKFFHLLQYENACIKSESKIELIAKKLEICIQKLNYFTKIEGRICECGVFPIDAPIFQKLFKEVIVSSKVEQLPYPKYEEFECKIKYDFIQESQELNTFKNQKIKELIKKEFGEEYKNLKNENSKQRIINYSLIHKKKMLSQFQEVILKNVQEKEKIALAKILDSIKEIYQKMLTESSITNPKTHKCSLPLVTPFTNERYHLAQNQKDLKKLISVHNRVTNLIETVEKMI